MKASVGSLRIAGAIAQSIKAAALQALAAKAFVERVITSTVTLSEIAPDKYAGRIDARVALATGADLTDELLAAGHGRPYAGSAGWCGS